MRRLIYLLAGMLVVSLNTGCAVLTVDVDVYKGPLANQQHVQTQQLSVMAIAAKPLLQKLKDDIQVMQLNENSKLRASNYKALNERIIAILTLYENQSPKEIRVLVQAMQDAQVRYNLAARIFDESNQRMKKYGLS